MNKSKEENTFKPVDKDIKVTNLGTFGNRKKGPDLNQVNQTIQIKPSTVSNLPVSNPVINNLKIELEKNS